MATSQNSTEPSESPSHSCFSNIDLLFLLENFPIEIQPVSWVDAVDGNIPDNAFPACTLDSAETAYVAKAQIADHIQTGLTTRNLLEAHIPYDYSTHRVQKFQVMVADSNSLYWVPGKNGHYPKNAVTGGKDWRKKHYIGRTYGPLTDGRNNQTYERLKPLHESSGSLLGIIHTSHKCLHVPNSGKVYAFDSYEVLCHKLNPGSLLDICKWKVIKTLYHNGKQKSSIRTLPLPAFMKEFLFAETQFMLQDDIELPIYCLRSLMPYQ